MDRQTLPVLVFSAGEGTGEGAGAGAGAGAGEGAGEGDLQYHQDTVMSILSTNNQIIRKFIFLLLPK